MFDITLRTDDHFSLLKTPSGHAEGRGLRRGGMRHPGYEFYRRRIHGASADFAYGRMTHPEALAQVGVVFGDHTCVLKPTSIRKHGFACGSPLPEPLEGV